jgi:hypothetical protein
MGWGVAPKAPRAGTETAEANASYAIASGAVNGTAPLGPGSPPLLGRVLRHGLGRAAEPAADARAQALHPKEGHGHDEQREDRGREYAPVVVRVGEAALFSERFEWPFPASGKPTRLAGKVAKRSRVVAGA